MSSRELKTLLDQVADTREVVLRRPRTWIADYDLWTDARDEAREAYRRWRATPAADTYAVYRAAQDREDAAQDTLALAQTQTSRTSVS
jgi:acyl-CoA reductase-like NAD-dependent aldehyde dehydrogenase